MLLISGGYLMPAPRIETRPTAGRSRPRADAGTQMRTASARSPTTTTAAVITPVARYDDVGYLAAHNISINTDTGYLYLTEIAHMDAERGCPTGT
jgi:hypothetical protein